MGDANPISRLGIDDSTNTRHEPLEIEVTGVSDLNYWERNLRAVLDQCNATLAGWIEDMSKPEPAALLTVWGPLPPMLQVRSHDPGRAQSSGGYSLLRFVDPARMTEETLSRFVRDQPRRVFSVQRAATGLDRVAALDLSPPTGDPTLTLRRIHLFTDYKLRRQKTFARRGARLHLAEFSRHEAVEI